MAEKLYYSMGEVAEMLDVTPTLLRFWEKRFDIIAPHRSKKGNRLFSPEDVRNLKIIYHLVKERGMTLAGAEKHLKAGRGNVERDVEIAERLGTIRALLLEVHSELAGGGTIVDSAHGEPFAQIAVEPTVIVEEVEIVTVESDRESEPRRKCKPEPEPEPSYVEQTLF